MNLATKDVVHRREVTLRARRQSPVSSAWKARRLLWAFVQATAFRFSFHTSSNWRAFLLRVFGARIDPGCTIRRTARVYYPWLLTMGSDSSLGDRTEVYNLGAVRIGNRVTVSQEAYLCAGTHDYRYLEMPLLCPPIVIDDDAWICARVLVAPGVVVGEGSIAAAGAVVTKNTAPWTIVGGNPAIVIGHRPPLQSLLEDA